MVRVSGPDTERLWHEAFGRNRLPEPRRTHLATYVDEAGQPVDQVVVVFFEEGHSFTGEASMEISAHGNPLIVQKILRDLQRRGCRMAEPGEFTRRAFMNKNLDLSQAEAVAHMIHARSEKALALAHKQLGGALGKRIHDLSAHLVRLLAELEAYIDFSEEDLPPEDVNRWAQWIEGLLAQISKLLKSRRYTQQLYDGIQVLILGAPNAGKSSLLNAFLGEDRALISDQPGTTRDFISEPCLLGDYPLHVIDTAGIHEAGSQIEAQGIRKTLERVHQADVFLLVLDGTLPVPALMPEVLEVLNQKNTVVVDNKADLPSFSAHMGVLPGAKHVSISAAQGQGVDALKSCLLDLLEAEAPQGEKDVLAVHERHAHALSQAQEVLGSALTQIQSRAYLELVASDLRVALEALGGIVGKVDNEAVLDVLFSSFCIGK